MNYTLKNENIVAYNESSELDFPKYTSQLINVDCQLLLTHFYTES